MEIPDTVETMTTEEIRDLIKHVHLVLPAPDPWKMYIYELTDGSLWAIFQENSLLPPHETAYQIAMLDERTPTIKW